MNDVQPIAELIETLIDYRGQTPPKTVRGIPLITAKVIKGGRITSVGLEFIAEESYDGWMRRGIPRSGDILITTEAPLGEVAQIGKDARVALAQRVILIRPDRRKVDPQFLFHYLRSPEAQARFRQRASGTTVSGIRQPELRAVQISLLARPDQEKVGRVLDVLDDLIQNNWRRVELLEQMAQAIYREWFVRFRYPGHEDATFVDSPLGPIPEVWEVGTLSSLAHEIRAPNNASETTSALPYVPIDAIDPRSITLRSFRPGAEAASSLRLFEKGDVLFGAMRAYFHKVCLAPFAGVTRSTCLVLRPDIDRYHYAVLTLAQEATVTYAAMHSTGSTIPYARWDGVLSQMPVPVPPVHIAQAFSEALAPLILEGQHLAPTNRVLESLRDLLLPKLVTGEIDVSELDLDAVVGSVV